MLSLWLLITELLFAHLGRSLWKSQVFASSKPFDGERRFEF
jgi:hypothetical protein